MASLLPALRQAAPRLTRKLFECSHHPSSFRVGLRTQGIGAASEQAFNPRTLIRWPSRSVSGFTQDVGTFSERSSPLGSLGRSFQDSGSRPNRFPETSTKTVAYWLLGSAASVFGIVVFGGLTRLTESGYVSCVTPESWTDEL